MKRFSDIPQEKMDLYYKKAKSGGFTWALVGQPLGGMDIEEATYGYHKIRPTNKNEVLI